jgi:hypothetical protein
MELGAVLSFFFFELLAGILVFFYWLRHYSQFDQARTLFTEAMTTHREHGTIEEYLLKVADDQASVFKKKKPLVLYLKILLSMIVGIAALICLKQLTALGVMLRTILSIFIMLPFMVFVAIAIAKEADENRIANFERAMERRVAARIGEESVTAPMPELAQETARS